MVRYTLIGEPKADLRDIEGFPKYKIDRTGKVVSFYGSTPRVLRTYLNNKGYECIDLKENGKRSHKLVHRLVAEAFIDNPENLPEINHKDEDKTNNCADNLEWCSHSYNNSYGYKIDRFKKTFKALCDTQGGPRQQECVCIETLEHFRSAKDAAKSFGVSGTSVRKSCLYGKKVLKEFHFRYVKDLVFHKSVEKS